MGKGETVTDLKHKSRINTSDARHLLQLSRKRKKAKVSKNNLSKNGRIFLWRDDKTKNWTPKCLKIMKKYERITGPFYG